MSRTLFILGCCVAIPFGLSAGQSMSTVTLRQGPRGQDGRQENTSPKSPQKTIALDLRDVPILDALRRIQREGDVWLVYDVDILPPGRRVTLSSSRITVLKALETVLAETGIQIRTSPSGKIALVKDTTTKHDSTQVERGTVTGVVLDSVTKQGIVGVRLAIGGTTLATTTDENGRFTLVDVPVGKQTLNAKGLGYRTKSVTVTVVSGQRITANLSLSASPTALSEVVTTATGVQRRMEIGSDITTINVQEVMKVTPISSVTDLLETRVPGMTVVRTSGIPGDPSRIRLRGAASIERGNNPIVIVDGVRMNYNEDDRNQGPPVQSALNNGMNSSASFPRPSALDQIDPNSIETIDVFKGPSASAMYGADAANGVIVITTKRGRPGAAQWSLTGSMGLAEIPGSYPTTAFGFGHLLTGGNSPGYHCQYSAMACVVDSLVAFQALNDPRYSPLHRGTQSSTSATIRGGVRALQYSFTGSASDEGGLVRLPRAARDQFIRFAEVAPPKWMERPDSYRRYGATSQLAAELNPTLRVKTTVQLTTSDQERSSLSLGAVGQLIGDFVDTTRLGWSPLLTGFGEQVTANTTTFMSSVDVDWQARPWATFGLNAGINQTGTTDKHYLPSGLPPQIRGYTNESGGYSIARGSSNTRSVNVRSTFQFPISGNRTLSMDAGLNVQGRSSGVTALKTSYIPPGVKDPTSFPSNQTIASQSLTAASTYGWYLQPKLDFHSRFFVLPGLRLDGGSASGKNSGLTGFPKINLSWLAIDPGDPDSRWLPGFLRELSALRFRGSFGYAGQQPDPASRLRLTTQQTVMLDGMFSVPSTVLASIGNTHLRPERRTEIEVGFDSEFGESRFTFKATAFRKKTLDAIQSMRIAPSVGGGFGTGVFPYVWANGYKVNIGTVTNTGFEMSASADVIRTAPLQWNVQVSMDHYLNKLTSTNAFAVNASPGGSDSRLVVGYPLDGIWVRPLRGYADLNGDNRISKDEVVVGDSAIYLGTQNPPTNAYLNTTMGLLNGRVHINANFSYHDKFTQRNGLAQTRINAAASLPNATLFDQAIAAYTDLMSVGITSGSQYFYQTVNTVRFESFSIGYTVPPSVARLFKSQIMSVSVQGRNLWLHTNYRGKDPNVNAFTRGEGTADFGQLPQPRTFILNVRLGN